MAPAELPCDVDDVPPSCRCILLAFRANDTNRLSRQELLEVTNLPESTLDDALRRLENRQCLIRTRKSDAADRVSAELRQPRG